MKMMKMFPADALGTACMRAIRIPIGHVPLLAVGGIGGVNIDTGRCRCGLCRLYTKTITIYLSEVVK